ncbi:MAG: PD-(D/E)XK nuclease family protein [Chloroflexota bacterium]
MDPKFHFSQSSLQDFTTCARRFDLRYLQQLQWPAVEAEPIQEAERLAKLGSDFHRMVHQHLVGIEAETIAASLDTAETELRRWWEHYLAYQPELGQAATLNPELTLSTPLRGYRLLARFDLLAIQPDGTFLIIDWKTSQRKPKRDKLAQRIQTRVYPYVLARAGAAFNQGQPINPDQIQMMYWYPQAPDTPEIFDYNEALFKRDEQFLEGLVEQIKQAVATKDFPLVEDRQACTYCVYRSFCDRGDKGGPIVEMEEEAVEAVIDTLALDWDQIAEIQF